MGIRADGIAPGAMRMASPSSVLTTQMRRTMLAPPLIRRLGEAGDMVEAALFLCAPN